MFLHLFKLEGGGYANSLSNIFRLETPTRQDDESFRQLRGSSCRKGDIFGLVQVAVQNFALLRIVLQYPLEVLHAVADMASFVLHHEPENLLINVRWREILAEAEQREHIALSHQMQRD